jgi:hypothetical protein
MTPKERVERLGRSVQKSSTEGKGFDVDKALSEMQELEDPKIALEELKSTGVIDIVRGVKERTGSSGTHPSSEMNAAAKQVLKKWKTLFKK